MSLFLAGGTVLFDGDHTSIYAEAFGLHLPSFLKMLQCFFHYFVTLATPLRTNPSNEYEQNFICCCWRFQYQNSERMLRLQLVSLKGSAEFLRVPLASGYGLWYVPLHFFKKRPIADFRLPLLEEPRTSGQSTEPKHTTLFLSKIERFAILDTLLTDFAL